MALKLWLPLNDSLRNIGLHKVSVVNNGATLYDNGLFGKCYSFTPSQYIELTNVPFSELNNCSVSFWIKLDANEVEWLLLSGQGERYYLLAWRDESYNNGNFYHLGTTVQKIYVDGVESNKPIRDGNWHHYCAVGVNFSTWTKLYLNRYVSTGNVYNFTGLLTDFRIYDHRITYQDVQRIYQNKEIIVLPYEYEELEYIQSTGTQYIDTLKKWGEIDCVEIEMESIGTNGNYAIFGASNGNAYSKGETAFFWNAGKYDTVIPTSNTAGLYYKFGTYDANTKYHIKYDKEQTIVTNLSNNDEYKQQNTNFFTNFTGNRNIALFASNRTSGYVVPGAFKLRMAKFLNESSFVSYFIPAKRKSDNVIGMYDLVSKKFFTNQGTGVFNAGPSVISLPKEYEKLEYIQSNGTQYIDTGINGFNSGDWEIYCEWMSVAAPAQSYGYIFGVYQGENYNSYRLIHKTTSTTEYYVSAKSKAGGGSILLSNVALNEKHSIKIKNGTFTCDGVSYTASTTGTSLPSANTMLLFKSSNNLYSKCRIYSTWAKKDGILKYNMIPSKRKSDNVIGMYDMVSGKFFTNSGTGSFTGA